ncbi:response regulator transcription factor, partial [Actinocorallia lasiicapitis]
ARAEPLRARALLDRIEGLRGRLGATAASHGLTPREREVLRELVAGRPNREIAQELFISAKTVSVHVSNILAKLGASSRGEAVAHAHRAGILSEADGIFIS